MSIEFKICKSCNKELPISNFYFRKESNSYRAVCKSCKRVNTKEEIQEKLKSELKVCKHCNIEKHISEYNKAGKGKWLQPYCKPCDYNRKKEYSEKNKEKIINKKKQYYIDNIIKIKEYNNNNREIINTKKREYYNNNEIAKEKKKQYDKKYQENNKEKLNNYYKNRRLNNLDYFKSKDKEIRNSRTLEQRKKISEWQKQYRIKNADKIKEYRLNNLKKISESKRINNNKRSKEDIEFRILKNLRSRTRFALKNSNSIKSNTTIELLGCSIEEFKNYFCSLFNNGMDWDIFMAGKIHIDHIIPCVNFDLKNKEEQKKCFHYTNLQPLWAIDNLKKGTKIIKECQLN